jgi:hypothetical protein
MLASSRGGFILPPGSWPTRHLAYKVGKLTQRQNSCILPMGQIAYVPLGLRNKMQHSQETMRAFCLQTYIQE